MKKLFLLLPLLCASPVAAASFFPNLAGQRYCDLRSAGATHEQALSTAIRENFSMDREQVMVEAYGKQYSTDVVELARLVMRCY